MSYESSQRFWNLCSPDCIVCRWLDVWGPPPDKRTVLIHRDLGNMVGIGRSVVDWDDEDL